MHGKVHTYTEAIKKKTATTVGPDIWAFRSSRVHQHASDTGVRIHLVFCVPFWKYYTCLHSSYNLFSHRIIERL